MARPLHALDPGVAVRYDGRVEIGGDGACNSPRLVVALVGSNLMKFGPLIGEQLTQAAESDELPRDLLP
jgi:hypothetical protein